VQPTPVTAAPNTTTGRPALREGAIFGVSLGVLSLIVSLISGFLGATGVGAILGIVVFVLFLGASLFAGIRASAKTGKVSTGLLAGLFVGLFASIISGIGGIIYDIFNLNTLMGQANKALQQTGSGIRYTTGSFLAVTVGGVVLVIVVYLLIGLAIGAIGGAIGRGRAPKPVTPYQESMYPGATLGAYPPPMASAPGYPPQQPPAYPAYPAYPPDQPPMPPAYLGGEQPQAPTETATGEQQQQPPVYPQEQPTNLPS
jgi:hypothetical protein